MGGTPLCLVRSLIAISEASNNVAMSTATQHTDIPFCISTALLTFTSVFKPLLRSSALTHVLQFNCLLRLHSHLQFPNIYTSQSSFPILCTTLSFALGHNLTPHTSTQGYSDFHNLFQGFRFSALPWHMNMSMTVSSYIVRPK